MSAYEDYKKTSSYFDTTRYPLGLEIIRKELERNVVSLNKQLIIDAGCGTGLYSEALINEVKFIEALDINNEMIDKAKTRLKNKTNIRFHRSNIDSLPFKNNIADAIIVNQVLHHLPDNSELFWSEHTKAFKEFFRVLKPRGRLIINSCSHKQLKNGFWYYHLIPKALNAILEKTIDLNILSKRLRSEGFSNLHQIVPFHLTLQGREYFNENGLFSNEWRSGDSIWSLVSNETLSNVLTRVTKLKKENKLKSFMKKHEKKRLSCGQITFTSAKK